MHTPHDRDQLAPPEPPARLRAIALAVLVHVALIGALTWGVRWKDQVDQPAVEAELWSAIPQQAAPAAVEPPPPPPPPPQEIPPEPVRHTPAPPPPPPPAVRTPQPEPDRDAQIAIEREKKRLEQEKKERERKEAERKDKDRKEQERKERLEQEKKERQQKEKAEREKAEKIEKAEKEKAERDKERREKLAEQKKAEQEKQKKQAEDKRKADETAQRKAEADAKQVAAQREANLRRMQGLAGASGGENATGNAQRSSGPSGSYGGKVAAKVKPNIVYPDVVSGNPRAVVEVRAAPDGTITGKRLIQSSGNKAWDEAVLRALDKTESLPRDVDGRVPSSLEIGFRPQD